MWQIQDPQRRRLAKIRPQQSLPYDRSEMDLGSEEDLELKKLLSQMLFFCFMYFLLVFPSVFWLFFVFVPFLAFRFCFCPFCSRLALLTHDMARQHTWRRHSLARLVALQGHRQQEGKHKYCQSLLRRCRRAFGMMFFTFSKNLMQI